MDEQKSIFLQCFMKVSRDVSFMYASSIKALEEFSSGVFSRFLLAQTALEGISEMHHIPQVNWIHTKEEYQHIYIDLCKTYESKVYKEDSPCSFSLAKGLLEEEGIPLVFEDAAISDALSLWRTRRVEDLKKEKERCVEELSRYICENITNTFRIFFREIHQKDIPKEEKEEAQRDVQKVFLILDRQVGEYLGIPKGVLGQTPHKIRTFILKHIEDQEKKSLISQ